MSKTNQSQPTNRPEEMAYNDHMDSFNYNNISEDTEEMHYMEPAAELNDSEDGAYGGNGNEHYQYESNNSQQEIEKEHADGLFNDSSISSVLNELGVSGNNIDEEIKELDKEEQRLAATIATSNTFKREERNILKENYAILTQKVEERQRRETLFTRKIIMKRSMLSQDLGHIVAPSIKSIKKNILKTKLIHEDNERKAKLKFNEAKNHQRTEFTDQMKAYDEMMAESVASMRNIAEWRKEIESINVEIATMKENESKDDAEIKDFDVKIQTTVQDFESYDLDKLQQTIEDHQITILEEEEKARKEIKEKEALLQVVTDSIIEFNIEQKIINNTIDDVFKNTEATVDSKRDVSDKIQDYNLKIQESHLEKLTIESVIQSELRKLGTMSKEIESSQNLLQKAGMNVNSLQTEIDKFSNEEEYLNNCIRKINSTANQLEKTFLNIDTEMSQRNSILINETKLQYDETVTTKKNECYDKFAIIEKEYDDMRNHFALIEIRYEETREDVIKKEMGMKELINETIIVLDNLNLELENKMFDITCSEEEIEREKQRHNIELTNLKLEAEKLAEDSEEMRAEYFKVTHKIEEDIKSFEEKVKKIEQMIGGLRLEILNQETETQNLLEQERKYQKANQDSTIAELETELNLMNISKMTEDLKILKEEREQIKMKLEYSNTDLKDKNDILLINEKELVELIEKVRSLKENRKLLDSIEVNKKQAIVQEEDNYKKEDKNLKAILKEKVQLAQKKLENMKRSISNKHRMFETNEIGRLEKKNEDTKNKMEQIRGEIKTLKEKKMEIEGTVEKKKARVAGTRDKLHKINQVLSDHGLQEWSDSMQGYTSNSVEK